MCRLPNSKHKPIVTIVSQLPDLIFGINYPVILHSPSQLMFLKGLWRHIVSKMHLTYSFIVVMPYIYIFYIHIVTMHAITCISISSIFTISTHFSFIVIVILQTISLFCIVLHWLWCTLYAFIYYIFHMYSTREHCGWALYKLINYHFYNASHYGTLHSDSIVL